MQGYCSWCFCSIRVRLWADARRCGAVQALHTLPVTKLCHTVGQKCLLLGSWGVRCRHRQLHCTPSLGHSNCSVDLPAGVPGGSWRLLHLSLRCRVCDLWKMQCKAANIEYIAVGVIIRKGFGGMLEV